MSPEFKVTDSEFFVILSELTIDFEHHKELIRKLLNQMPIPRNTKDIFWDRFLYIYKKLHKE